jgi:hypothetical protein
MFKKKRGGNATSYACPKKIITFHSNIISEGGFRWWLLMTNQKGKI